MTGSLAVVTNGTEFQVTSTGVKIGNVIGDTHSITGSVGISGSLSGSSATFSSGATFFNGGNTFVFAQNVLTSGNVDGAHIRNVISTAANPTYAWSGDTDTGMYSDTANTIGFSTSGSNRMTISSDGSMGFGGSVLASRSFVFRGLTSKPIVIEAVENAGVHSMFFRPNNSGYNLISSNYISGGTYLPLSLSGRENTSDFVLTTAGSVGINTTSPAGRLQVNGAGGSEISFQLNDSTSRRVFCIPSQYYGYIFAISVAADGGKGISFGNGGGASEVGSIVCNNASTTYNTTSDYRLKEDLKDFNGLNKISAIKVYDFKWKTNEERTNGVLAHELAEVLPYAVHGEKDGLDRDGNPSYQGVDYSKIVPSLIKAIQELKTQNDALQSRIETLESK